MYGRTYSHYSDLHRTAKYLLDMRLISFLVIVQKAERLIVTKLWKRLVEPEIEKEKNRVRCMW